MRRIVVKGGRRLSGRIQVSGSKNAVLKLMAASLLTSMPSVIRNVPRIRDVFTMVGVLEHLGVRVRFDGDVMEIHPPERLETEAPDHLVRAMRASVQVMGPLLARAGRALVAQPGGCEIGARPIDFHLKGFQAMGASVTEAHGHVLAEAPRLRGTTICLDFPSVGATENLMMAACLAEGTTVIQNAAKEPEVVEVQNFLNRMGAQVSGAGTGTITVTGVSELRGIDHTVIPDRIEAGTFMVAAAITGGELFVEGAMHEHLDVVTSKLREAGAVVEPASGGIHVVGPVRPEPVTVVTLPYPGFPTDMQPQMLALCTLAHGTSIITEMVHTNRFKHVDELRRLGADIRVEGRTAVVRGVRRLTGATIEASDLRAGAALVVAALAAEGETVIEGAEHIERGYERLIEKLTAAGAAMWAEG